MKQKRLIVNLISTSIAFIVQFGVNFFLTPYIINSLGSEAYSYIPIANNFVGYTNIITVAFYSMTGRFVSIEYNQKKYSEATKYFNSALISNCFLVLILVFPALVFTVEIEHIINVPVEFVSDVKLTFGLSFANMLLTLSAAAFGSVYYVTNRLDINAKRNIEGNILRAIILIGMFSLLPVKIYYLNATILLVGIYLVCMNIYYTRKLMPEIRVNFRASSLSAIKTMLSSGIWNSLNQASNIMLTTLDLFLANLFAGSYAAGLYSVSKTVPNFILSIITMLVGVFVPQLTIYFAKQKKRQLNKMLSYSIRFMGVVCSFPIGFLIIFGKDFFQLWVPTQNSSYLHILSILTLIPLAISCCTEVVYNIFTIVNKLKVPAFVLFGLGILNTIGVLVLLNFTSLGVIAIPIVAIIVSVLRNLIFTPIYASRFCLSISNSYIYIAIARGLLCTLIMVIISMLYRKFIYFANTWSLFILAAIVCSICAAAVNFFVIFDKDERREFSRSLLSKMDFLRRK